MFSGLTFVLHFYVDVKLYPGYEKVMIKKMGKTGEKELSDSDGDYVDIFFHENEDFYLTGNISLVKSTMQAFFKKAK